MPRIETSGPFMTASYLNCSITPMRAQRPRKNLSCNSYKIDHTHAGAETSGDHSPALGADSGIKTDSSG